LRCCTIDVSVELSERSRLAGQIIGELGAEPYEPVVAYRDSRRWVETFEPTKLPKAQDSPVIRDGGVYLVTGGLGNIRLVVAESLARAASGVRLVLVGGSALPERAEWEQWMVAQGTDDAVSRKLTRLIAIEELGAEVVVVSADSSDYEQMRSVAERVHET